MNDDTQAIPPAPQSGNGSSNPLDSLEALLENAKKKGAAAGKPAAADGIEPKGEEGPSEQELLAGVELKKQALKQEEQVLVQQQIAAMQQEAVTAPQSQARQQQDKERVEQQSEQTATSEKYKIHQLGHTKI